MKSHAPFGYDSGSALAIMAALAIASRSASRTRRAEPIRTREQIAAADKRSERQRWNDEVEATKQAKMFGAHNAWAANCMGCDAYGPSTTKPEAITAWNRRAAKGEAADE